KSADERGGGLSLTANWQCRCVLAVFTACISDPHHPSTKIECRGVIMKRLSSRWLAGLVFAGVAISTLTPARAGVVVHIDKYAQRMAVSIDGYPRYNWPVSTGRSG